MAGKLFIIATPIGNLEDITIRALRTLRQVDVIAAEDTRHTRQLLSKYKIHKRMIACHDHNEAQMAERILDILRAGQNIALVSDAGTPGISDPGFELVRRVVSEGCECVPIPGPSALTSALSISHLPVNEFIFLGFLPKKPGIRKRLIEKVKNERKSLVFFLSPHNALVVISNLNDFLGDRPILLCRELTKVHEEIWRGSLADLRNKFTSISPRGEMTLILSGSIDERVQVTDNDLRQAIKSALNSESGDRRSIIKCLANRFGRSAREIYRLSLDLNDL